MKIRVLAGPCVVFLLAMAAWYQCASASGDTFWGMVAVVASVAVVLWTCFATAGLYE